MPRDVSLGEAKRGTPGATTSDPYRVEFKAAQDVLLIGVQVSVDMTSALTTAQQAGFFRALVLNGPASEVTVAAGNVGSAEGGTGAPLADHSCPFPFMGGSPTMLWLFKVMRAGDVITVVIADATLDGSSGGSNFPGNVSFVQLPLADFIMPSAFGKLR